jgi:hypothetical protein
VFCGILEFGPFVALAINIVAVWREKWMPCGIIGLVISAAGLLLWASIMILPPPFPGD